MTVMCTCGEAMPNDGEGPIVALLAHHQEAHTPPADPCPRCGTDGLRRALLDGVHIRWCEECAWEAAA